MILGLNLRASGAHAPKFTAGGAYLEVTSIVKKVDDFEKLIVMQNGTKIPMDDILSIEGDIFSLLQFTE